MRIRLDPEQVEPLVWEETQEFPSQLVDSSSLQKVGLILCRGRLERVSSGFLFQTEIEYEQTLVCTRCLKSLRENGRSAIELLLVLSSAQPEQQLAELELQEDDLNVLRVSDEFFDSEPLVNEHVQLQVPMKPLCKGDCRGLCPRCGADRNLAPDCCSETGYDSRWSELRVLRDQLRNHEQ